MKPYYENDGVTLYLGDCIEVMRSLPDNSVHAVVTDPPYGLEFMGKGWDGADGFRRSLNAADAGRESVFGRASRTSPEYKAGRLFGEWCEAWATEALRVLKPGGHLLAFGGTRTWSRLSVGVEDAGFEIRDSIAWLYGSGFPKSMDVSKAIERRERGDMVRAKLAHFAAERGIDGKWLEEHGVASGASFNDWTVGGHVPSDANWQIVKSALEVTAEEEAGFEREVLASARSRAGDGTVYALGHSGKKVGGAVTDAAKEWEGWGTALKPAFEPIVVARKPLVGTVAANVLARGTGALNIDATRTATTDPLGGGQVSSKTDGWDRPWKHDDAQVAATRSRGKANVAHAEDLGRWPTNVVLDESQAAELDKQTGILTSGANPTSRSSDKFRNAYGDFKGQTDIEPARGADSGGASRFFPTFHYEAKAPDAERPNVDGLQHPTVKPLDLMRWLVRLVTPLNGTVLEPFAGSGTTIEAALIEGFNVIGIEREADYLPLIMQRITKPLQQSLFGEGLLA